MKSNMNHSTKERLNSLVLLTAAGLMLATTSPQVWAGDAATIHVNANQVEHHVSRLLTGACIEDVNHEIYGGIYSQMIFGESFQEPAPALAPKGFTAYGGQWRVQGNELHFTGTQGDKLVSEMPPFEDGEVGVEIFIADTSWPNVGMIVRTANAGNGMDHFDGYEIALNAAKQTLLLGRHRQNWKRINETHCNIPVGQWLPLSAKLEGRVLEVFLKGRSIVRYEDKEGALLSGSVGLRAFQSEARYRNFWVKTNGTIRHLDFGSDERNQAEVSGMWRSVNTGNAVGTWEFEKTSPFVGSQSQRMTFTSGTGSIGVENQGLNRWKMYFKGEKSYQGVLCARTEKTCEIWVSMENVDGTKILAERKLRVKEGDWQRLEFSLTPKNTESKGRFTVKLKQPGSVVLGYAFLQPGEWGRFKGLPVRKDVIEGLIYQGITVLRYGGSMINHQKYRWKKMIGPREHRQPNAGTWYRQSSNGWGIPDFMNMCEAAGFEYIPAFNMDETPEDMADFIEYAKGAVNTKWGHCRASDGHPSPYHLHYIELGNEESVDEKYAAKFERLARAVWDKDKDIILVVGDFCYDQKITDPNHIHGAAGGMSDLNGQKRILHFAKENNREVWFDVHVGTAGPRPDSSFDGMFSFKSALAKIADGARYHVAVFELNAFNHDQRRAIGNALAINAAERDGTIPIVTSANCLQPDGQNDNGWDQGLLFLNPSQVWLQPPGYVTRMISRHYQPLLVKSQVARGGTDLDVTAKRSENGKVLVLQVVNVSDKPCVTQLNLDGFMPSKATAKVEELSAPMLSYNTALWPERITSKQVSWKHELKGGKTRYEFPPNSLTVIEFE